MSPGIGTFCPMGFHQRYKFIAIPKRKQLTEQAVMAYSLMEIFLVFRLIFCLAAGIFVRCFYWELFSNNTDMG